ncbi:MAG: ATP-binding protein [Leptospira sp.]|nr:ATP-binding protein [Leptospira sp.]
MKIKKYWNLFFVVSFYCLMLIPIHSYDIAENQTTTSIDEIRYEIEKKVSPLSFRRDQSRNEKLPKLTENNGNFGFLDKPIWLYFEITNKSISEELFIITFPYPYYDELDFYEWDSNNQLTKEIHTGDERDFSTREVKSRYFSFRVALQKNETKYYAVRIHSIGRKNIYFWLDTLESFIETTEIQTLLLGFYFGSVLVMIVYNAFLFFSIKDLSYFIYIVYLFLVFFVSLSYNGLANKYLWPKANFYSSLSVPHGGILLSLVALLFSYVFLELKNVKNKLIKITSIFLILLNLLLAVISLWLPLELTSLIANFFSGLVVAIFILALSIYRYKSKFRQAKYFLVAWVIPIVTVISITIIRKYMALNQIVDEYAENFAFFVEMVFFSLSLADRINILRKEKLELMFEQNELLENKIGERTKDLEKSLKDLADAQEILIRSEKMTILGQMIAGISHEINNPISAIKSSYENLNTEFQNLLDDNSDYFKSYQNLSVSERSFLARIRELNGRNFENSSSVSKRARKKVLLSELNSKSITISEELVELLLEYGFETLDPDSLTVIRSENFRKVIELAHSQIGIEKSLFIIENSVQRVSKIIFALKSYNYTNPKADPIEVDLAESIEIVLTIYENLWKRKIKIHKNYTSPHKIIANPEEIIQVWTNILHNSFQAIEGSGNIWINILSNSNDVIVEIIDDGSGIDKSIQDKIFEPFFTTKKYGNGTGLGLDIVRKLLQKMGASLNFSSSPGNTKFTFTFPITGHS